MWSTLIRFAIVLISVALNASQPNYTNFSISSRIVGGEPVTNNQIPWQVALLYGGSLVCGGSIISPYWVVTAAHCILANAHFTVRAGSIFHQKNGQIRKSKSIIIHKRFNIETMDNDIALIRLDLPFIFDKAVQPCRLAEFRRNSPLKVVVSGWGLTNENATTLSNYLMMAKVSIVTPSECQKAYGEIKITKNMICAVDPNKDSCSGDSGGPLFFGNELIGIVSFGIGCARSDYPGVYTSVSGFNLWIKRKISELDGSRPTFS
ncbi:trypsin alpha-like [Glossina fuscipes]|uniref:Trypsin alpha-like n=1 Tax=Glossina fuscipes TaxID=7396 RepID=A0A8U0W8R7_9MUSC|nr:trypsin alpha-like [Glossina fuscipes]